ncbi:hypothetical protein Patl1_36670 [Pistacia atlantica]|nr:hypothetical protein Patl1_36670 [Pistacia atlantica]
MASILFPANSLYAKLRQQWKIQAIYIDHVTKREYELTTLERYSIILQRNFKDD